MNKEIIRNEQGIAVKKQCGSCRYCQYTYRGRECREQRCIVHRDDICDRYLMSKKFDKAGSVDAEVRLPVRREYQQWLMDCIDKFRSYNTDGSPSQRVDWEAYNAYMHALGMTTEKGTLLKDAYNIWKRNYSREKPNKKYINGYGNMDI